jgi:hydrogenase/urease accessory protein HupE
VQVFRSHPFAGSRVGRRGLGFAVLGMFWGVFLVKAPLATGHTRTSTISEISVSDDAVQWSLRIRVLDLLDPLGLPASAGMQELMHAREAASRYVLNHLRVATPHESCEASALQMVADPTGDEPRILLPLRFNCGTRTGALVLYYELFFDLDPLHTGFARVSIEGLPAATHLFRMGGAPLSISGAPDLWKQTLQYLVLGIEHIFLGYDHLAFLAALILGTALVRRSRRRAAPPVLPEAATRRQALIATVQLVTAFTAAHSITLAVAALSVTDIPIDWVEPAIALSVAYVGFENLVPRINRRRWLLTFGFGLVHGFGFASVLQDIGLPKTGLLRSLLAFNLGVELGQLAVVSAVLPFIIWAATRNPGRFERWGFGVVSATIGIAGMVWFILRVL